MQSAPDGVYVLSDFAAPAVPFSSTNGVRRALGSVSYVPGAGGMMSFDGFEAFCGAADSAISAYTRFSLRLRRGSPRARWIAYVALLAATLVGCGGGDSASDEPPAAAPPAPAAVPAPTPTEGAVPWPAPDDPLERAQAAGLTPGRREFLAFHVHAHLDVFLNGEPVEVPAAIGIEIRDPGVQSSDDGLGGTAYGGIDLCDQPCISSLHTHDRTGILHTESALEDPNTLGQFFIEWDVRLDEECVGGYCEPEVGIAVYVDGLEFGGDPATIALDNGREIAIVIGTPPAEIPASYDFSGGV